MGRSSVIERTIIVQEGSFFLLKREEEVVKMKTILIFACLVTLAVAQTADELFQQFTKHMEGPAKECAQEMGLDEDVIGRFVTERQNSDIQSNGCLKACTMKKLGLIVRGKLLLDRLHGMADTVVGHQSKMIKDIYKVQRACTARTKHFNNDCQLALEFFNCGSTGLDYIVQ